MSLHPSPDFERQSIAGRIEARHLGVNGFKLASFMLCIFGLLRGPSRKNARHTDCTMSEMVEIDGKDA
jgi:hypothetical protein